MNRADRDSNIELLRIICMLGIIAHHAVVHGGALSVASGSTKLFAYALLPAGKIGFTCFLAISMWFLCTSKFKGRRFISTWLEVLFYTLGMTTVASLLGVEVSVGQWVGSLLPIGGISHGFAATYLAFYLLLPLLTKASENLSKAQTIWIIIALSYVQIVERVLSLFAVTTLSIHPFVSEITLFVLFFFFMLYLRTQQPNWSNSKTLTSITTVLMGLIVFIIAVAPYLHPSGSTKQFCELLSAINQGENGIFNIIGGISLFLFFKNLTMSVRVF